MKSTIVVFAKISQFTLVFISGISIGCSRQPVTKSECDRLLASYTEKLIASEQRELSGTERHRLLTEVQTSASAYPPFQRCTAEVGREQMDCALAANHLDEIERCLIPMP